MIVGLKKRFKSKKFYDLAVRITIRDGRALVYTYQPQKKWSSWYGAHYVTNMWVASYLTVKICDAQEPLGCGDMADTCEHRFKCATSKVDIPLWRRY